MTNKVLLIHGLFCKRFFAYRDKGGIIKVGYNEKTDNADPYRWTMSFVYSLKNFLRDIKV